ncbi:MAG: nicotinamide-nucleotide amidohydrolase family protein, partial [Immundisolibacteraceae bacterium]|nr:nicotinamide-nucleotide amidohydrolase family protein [Immundisolibacteraceae bacterium]
ESGFSVDLMLTTGDRREDLSRAIEISLQQSDYLFISGGLGPTEDDLTSEVVAGVAGVDTQFDLASWQHIERKFKEFGIPLTDNNRKQAFFPDGAEILANPNGTAPGFEKIIERDGITKRIVALPGPPREMGPMIKQYLLTVVDVIKPNHEFIHFFGIGESTLAAALKPWEDQHEELGFRALFPEVEIKIYDPSPEKLRSLRQFVVDHLSDYLVDFEPRGIPELFSEFLLQQQLTFATAESCTGGWIGKLITDKAGCSNYYKGGVISYSNESKTDMLNVQPNALEIHGAVSEEVAKQMAVGARDRLGADIALSTTGIAGPDGGTDDKPVGTVWVGLATSEGVEARKLKLIPGRERIRICSAYEGLRWVMRPWLEQRWASKIAL